MLPTEFRERVFEPAYADLQMEEARASTTSRVARAVLIAECLRIGVPQHFWRRRRPTRLGLTVVCAIVVVGAVMTRLRYAAEWRANEMRTPAADRQDRLSPTPRGR